MNEIIFLVENEIEGGYTAQALVEFIFTEGDGLKDFRANICGAVNCHFETKVKPKVIGFD